MRRDLGDFQTPAELAAALVRRLGPIGSHWPVVLEPSCGRGAFLEAVLSSSEPPTTALGIEIQASYAAEARARLDALPAGRNASIVQADLFRLNLRDVLPEIGAGPLLVVGNPPWITSAELGAIGSDNRPPRRNVKALAGLDARTGAANFDLGEAVWLKLIDELADRRPTIAMLCKTSVARAVLQHVQRAGIPASGVEMVEIDARRWFDASVSACFLTLSLAPAGATGRVAVFDAPDAILPYRSMGSIGGFLASDLDALEALGPAFGRSPVSWRQGVKHDAAPVMELTEGDGVLRNGLRETVDVEPEFLYPLIKGADLRRPPPQRPRRALIVTQQSLGAETRDLADRAPRLWAYLQAHASWFDRRRSSVYRSAPPFAMFGIGPYTFAPYKAAVAGLHRPSLFRAVGPVDGRPSVFDDTCYLLPCESALEAAVLTSACNGPAAQGVLRALTFDDAKRLVTKSVLRMIDLGCVLERADRAALVAEAGRTLLHDLEIAEVSDSEIVAEIDRLIALLSPPNGRKLDQPATVAEESTLPENRSA